MIASLAVEMHVAPRDLIGDVPEATSAEMLATLVNYMNWRSEMTKNKRSTRRR